MRSGGAETIDHEMDRQFDICFLMVHSFSLASDLSLVNPGIPRTDVETMDHEAHT